MVVTMAKVFGLGDLDRALGDLPAALEQEVGRALDEGAARVAGLAKSLAPQDTSTLVESIHVEPGETSLSRRVVAGGVETTKNVVDYAVVVEHGADHHPPHPFMRTATEALARSIVGRLAGAAEKALRKVRL